MREALSRRSGITKWLPLMSVILTLLTLGPTSQTLAVGQSRITLASPSQKGSRSRQKRPRIGITDDPADLSVTKTDTPDPVVAGTNLTYTITVNNGGPDPALSVSLTDSIPANTTFVSCTAPAGWTLMTPPVGGTGTVTVTNPNVAASTMHTFTLVVNVNANTLQGSTITNTATVSSSTPDSNTSNNTDTETTAVNARADLSVTKTDSPDPVNAGGNLTYTLTVTNAGQSDAQNVSLADAVPANTTFVSAMQTTGPAFTLTTPPVGGTGTFTANLATLAAGATATFTMTVNVNAGTLGSTVISNTATVTSSTTDMNLANNSDTETTAVNATDLAVTKTDTPDPVIAGTNLTYTIIVNNGASDPALSVSLTDSIPTNTTFVSCTAPAGWTLMTPPVGGTGTVTVTNPSVAASTMHTFTLVVNVNANTLQGSTISNTATVSSSTPDSNTSNNTDTETTAVNARADLSVTKTDSPDPVNAGGNLTYTLTVTNAGQSDAQNVSLADAVPANTTFVSAMQTTGPAFTLMTPPVGGTGTFTANLATLAAGATATFTMTVNVNAGTLGSTVISNTATVTSSTTDMNLANNSDTETTAVNATDLAVTKTDTPDPVVAGSNVTYTITVSSGAGSDPALSVSLSDTIPANTTFVSFVAPAGWTAMAPAVGGTGTVTATNPSVAASTMHVFTLVVNVNASAPQGSTISNTATVSSSTPDSNTSNNTDTEITAVNARADLSVTKTDSPDPVNAGGNLTYTLTVSNFGPSDAQSVSLADAVPANTTFVSAMQTSGPAFTLTTPAVGGTGTFTATLATLAAGATATFTMTVNVNAGTSGSTVISNTATVSSSTTDPIAANNSDTETTAVINSMALIISEFRLRGPNGANDEFIEIYNATGASHTVASASGSGYGVAASDGTTRCSIPNGTVIPNRGHFLCVNSVGYSLASYPAGNGTTATGDATYTADIPDNAGIALFNNNAGGASYSLANRLDAVGSTSEANTVYKEGTGYPALTPFSIDYSFYRDNCGKQGSITTFGACPSGGNVVDTNNNSADFIFVDTNGTSAGAGQRLGAPGPENLSSPIERNAPVISTLLDPCVAGASPPNRVRDTGGGGGPSTFGTLDIRRTFTNNSGAAVTRLRFRVVDITTFPAPSGIADLRPLTSTAIAVTVDRPPCGSGTSGVTVQGTTLEQPPSQPNGGGFNSSLSAGTITLATPLANGAAIDLRFLLGVQQTGLFKFYLNVEALP